MIISPNSTTSGDTIGLMRCANCGRRRKYSQLELVQLDKTVWPQCGDRAMTLILPAASTDQSPWAD